MGNDNLEIESLIETDIAKLQGLAIRVDRILREEMGKEGMKFEFAEARMYNVRAVGVQGDDRSYKYITEITICRPRRANEENYLEEELYDFLGRLSSRVTNDIDEINRVVLVTGTKYGTFFGKNL